MGIDYFKDEIDRAYRVLGYQAECQNKTDIDAWYDQGFINESERNELRDYNKYFYLD